MEQKAAILDRILTLKDYSPFILICDSLAQTADYLLKELEFRRKEGSREISLLYDLNQHEDVVGYVQRSVRPQVPVVGVFHTDNELHSPSKNYQPEKLALLEFMATTIIKIEPSEEAQQRLADFPVTGIFDFSNKLFNRPTFKVNVEHRRKTGRSLTGSFIINTESHKVQFLNPLKKEEQDIPEGLTTFNLKLTDKQKMDKENVDLPFFEAQNGPGMGGAIVYQYEKDDDYDEEDPYEDPF